MARSRRRRSRQRRGTSRRPAPRSGGQRSAATSRATGKPGRHVPKWTILAGLGVAGAAVVVLVRLFGGPSLPEPPDPDPAGMEPAVAATIRRAREAVVADPGSVDRWANLGGAFLAHELYVEAAAAYRSAAALAGGDSRWSYLEARALWTVDPTAAEAAVLESLRLEPDYAPARLLAGQLAEDAGTTDAARNHYEAVVAAGGRTAPANAAAARFRLGRLLVQDGDLEAALPLLERAEALAPESGAVAAVLARVYRRTGDAGQARAAAERARSLEHDLMISDPLMDRVNAMAASLVGRERRAFAAEDAGRPDVAEQLLREMIAARPDSADLHYNLGNNLSRQGRNPEALEAWAAALHRNPDHLPTLINSSIVLAQGGNLVEAERRCRRVLAIRPDHPGALSSLGSIAALAGRTGEALDWFEEALAVQPERAGTHDSFAQVLAAERRFPDAIRHFRIAVSKEPFRADYRLGLAAALAATGAFEAAWAQAHEGRRLGAPLPDDFLERLGQALPDPGRR